MVNAVVVMCQDVSRALDLLPWDLRVSLSQRFRDSTTRFANNINFALHRGAEKLVFFVAFSSALGEEPDYCFSRLEHVIEQSRVASGLTPHTKSSEW